MPEEKRRSRQRNRYLIKKKATYYKQTGAADGRKYKFKGWETIDGVRGMNTDKGWMPMNVMQKIT